MMSAAKMHAAMMSAAEMAAAKVSAAVTATMASAAMTSATASAECSTGQYGCKNQDGNSNTGLRHGFLAAPCLITRMTPEGTKSSRRRVIRSEAS
jgi:hypothetical protein